MGSQHVRAIIDGYRHRLAYFRGLQQIPGSTWTDATVAEAMRPHRADAADALYRAGLDRDQVAGLLAEPDPQPKPARTLTEHINQLFRAGRQP
jgi:predicted DNA-binding helix-hairpin-helix protein